MLNLLIFEYKKMDDFLTNEIKEEGSKSNTNEIDNIINSKDKNDSINYSNNNINVLDNEINNNKENNIEHDIEENNIEYNNIKQDDVNYNNNLDNINENNNYIFNNNINTERKENINVSNNKEIVKEKDIIDELIEKIRNNQDLNISKDYKKMTISELDEEVKIGLETLNNIKTGSNKKTILDTQNELERKSFERNKKYNEVISELTKPIKQFKNDKVQYKTGTYFDFKNMQIIKPTFYFQTERKNEQIYEHPTKIKNKFYTSSIDGKIIVNGERKFLDKNFYKNDSQIFSYTKKRNIENKYNFPDFGFRKLDYYYNKNYFVDELKKMDKLLFN